MLPQILFRALKDSSAYSDSQKGLYVILLFSCIRGRCLAPEKSVAVNRVARCPRVAMCPLGTEDLSLPAGLVHTHSISCWEEEIENTNDDGVMSLPGEKQK